MYKLLTVLALVGILGCAPDYNAHVQIGERWHVVCGPNPTTTKDYITSSRRNLEVIVDSIVNNDHVICDFTRVP